jgi:hypothetical protein
VELDGSNASYHYQLAAVCGVLAEHASLFKKVSWAKRFKRAARMRICRRVGRKTPPDERRWGEEADKAAALDQNNVDARFALMEFYRQAPRLMGGDKRKARQMVEEITKADPARGYVDAAILAREEKDDTSVEPLCSKALLAGPKSYDVLIGASEFYRFSQSKSNLSEKYAREP